MKHSSKMSAVIGSAIAVVLAAGGASSAQAIAMTPHEVVAQSSTSTTVRATFNLLSPYATVVFTVDGNVVGTEVADANGDVTINYTPSGLAPGYYRLVATADTGISSSTAFGVK